MIERYNLNGETLPTIPTPHDCVIEKIEITDEFIVFNFEEDIYERDSINYVNPNAKSLIIRIHLTDPNFNTYKYKFNKLLSKEKYVSIKNSQLKISGKDSLQYLYHYLGYCSVIIKLWQDGYILMEIDADYIELEWII